ncbi:MAG: hypothetical protein DCC65_14740 [Planctomycetota bacterium]|nr:MAG: hypothetical protein DCC65_14740 [Planctomycetota bacterium]
MTKNFTRRARFIPRTYPALALAGALLALAPTGCAEKPQRKIADMDPYVGGRPAPMQPIRRPPPRPEPVARRPAPQPSRPASGDSAWTPARGISGRWECIVIHHSGSDTGSPQSMREWHVRGRGWDDLGYHFVIGNGVNYPDGQVFVGGRWNQQKHGAHCKTPNNYYNDHGIGICLIGDLDDHPPTPKQIATLARLADFLTQKCRIPRSKIHTHGGVTHKTACPGKHFALSTVLRKMSSYASTGEDYEPDVEVALDPEFVSGPYPATP